MLKKQYLVGFKRFRYNSVLIRNFLVMTVFEMASKYYPKLWDKKRLAALVELNNTKPGKGITAEDYEKITGEAYQAQT